MNALFQPSEPVVIKIPSSLESEQGVALVVDFQSTERATLFTHEIRIGLPTSPNGRNPKRPKKTLGSNSLYDGQEIITTQINDYVRRLHSIEVRGKRLVIVGYALKAWTAVAALIITTGLLKEGIGNQALGISILAVTTIDTAFTFLGRVVVAKEASVFAGKAISIRDRYQEALPDILKRVKVSGTEIVAKAETDLAIELRSLYEQIKKAIDDSDIDAIRRIKFDAAPGGRNITP